MEDQKHELKVEQYTCKDFKQGFIVSNDPWNIGNYANTPVRRKFFVECPFIHDEEFSMLTLVRVDGMVAGRGMSFPTLFKAGDKIYNCAGGSSLFVKEEFRQYGVAIEITTCNYNFAKIKATINADFSEDGIKVCRALRQSVFSLKKLILPRNSRFILENKGLNGTLLKITVPLANLFIRPLTKLLNYHLPKRLKCYTVTEVDNVPEWVDEISLNDGHKYMEVHNQKWFQWCLHNMFHDKPENKNHFFIVYKGDTPFGFFMTKERYISIRTRNISPMLMGTVVEWGSKDEKVLSEYDLIRLAIPTFSKKTDMIQVFSDDDNTVRLAKKHAFVHHGFHYIAFRDITKSFKEAKDQKLWRLRFGYSDSIMN